MGVCGHARRRPNGPPALKIGWAGAGPRSIARSRPRLNAAAGKRPLP